MPNHIHRRTLLQGLGTALALPLLDCMTPIATAAEAQVPAIPMRLAYMYVPNGINMADWTPAKDGKDYDLPWILEPLGSYKNDFCVLTGLTQQKAFANGDGGGDHARALATFLTGTQAKKTHGADIRAGISADQIAAQKVGRFTRFPSLEIGCEAGGQSGNCDSGYSCAYSNSIAWRTESTPVSKEINPKLVFERLFTSGRPGESAQARAKREKYNKSVLDFVMEDAGQLAKTVGQADKRKLEEYLSAVRELELRIAKSSGPPTLDGQALKKPEGIPDDYREHLRLMADLMALAFQTDTTRVVTYVLANEGSNRPYKMLDIPDGHHDLSHHGKNAEKLAKIRKINRFHIETLAYLLEKLRTTPEADSNLLARSMILYGSGISDGDRHNHDDLPLLLCGHGGGSITAGRHVRYKNGTPMTNLHLSLLDRLGTKWEVLGDSTGRVDQLKV